MCFVSNVSDGEEKEKVKIGKGSKGRVRLLSWKNDVCFIVDSHHLISSIVT
jgi:hypothetical protein